MKKTLDTTAIMNELRGQSVFFPNYRKEKQPETHTDAAIPAPKVEDKKPVQQETTHTERFRDTAIPQYHDTMTPNNHDTKIPLDEEDVLETVRKAVKQVGKEAATQRLTLEEKQALVDIEYSYKRQGIKTSGNEIMRIATNYIVRDYRINGENSILAKIIKRLNS